MNSLIASRLTRGKHTFRILSILATRAYSTQSFISENGLPIQGKYSAATNPDLSEVLSSLYQFINKKDKNLNSIVHIFAKDNVLKLYKDSLKSQQSSKKAESIKTCGDEISSELPLIVLLKDNYNVLGEPTTCASNILKGFVSPFTATVAELLQKSGALCIGKVNMDEFAMGSTTTSGIYGNTINWITSSKGLEILEAFRNETITEGNSIKEGNQQSSQVGLDPVFNKNEQRSCGGSSGGSAVSVASRFCNASLGSDTGGSVRLPASWCGVVGFKPTYGMCSRYGLVSYANSFDTVGIAGENVSTTKKVFDIINSHDPNDMTSISRLLRDQIKSVVDSRNSSISLDDDDKLLGKLKIGIPKLFGSEGASIKEVSLPNTKYALSAYYTLVSAEASSNLAKYDGVRYGYRHSDVDFSSIEKGLNENEEITNAKDTSSLFSKTRSFGFGPEVKRRIMLGNYVLSLESFKEYYEKAQHVRNMIIQDFDKVFRIRNVRIEEQSLNDSLNEGCDLLLVPTSSTTAPLLDDILQVQSGKKENSSNVDIYMNDVMTVPMSLAGLPTVCIPVGVSGQDGLPIGLQLVGQYGDDEMVLRVANILEKKLLSIQNTSQKLDELLPLIPKIVY
ncbi:hypothetical protein BB560_001273 [Smittium megazygosporum]|uniref:Glutamyl-tRNA(Gln) amidotransferase subunit A, mitochondrial n=1 Tax=Smittium megazygosporum TaxID=133381 RepID=A0A2T9ZI94_9FUNG|nr:hypothetical protein BB560_001273 [Smittium megazygosporum]